MEKEQKNNNATRLVGRIFELKSELEHPRTGTDGERDGAGPCDQRKLSSTAGRSVDA